MPTVYIVYVTVLLGKVGRGWGVRVKGEIDEKKIIPSNQTFVLAICSLNKPITEEEEESNQTGFRKGMGVIDNIYGLNYFTDKRIKMGRGNMTAMFVDLKTTFDSLDREEIDKTFEKRG